MKRQRWDQDEVVVDGGEIVEELGRIAVSHVGQRLRDGGGAGKMSLTASNTMPEAARQRGSRQ